MLKIEMGIGWVPDPDKPGHLVSAKPSEYADEIQRLRALLVYARVELTGVPGSVETVDKIDEALKQ